MNYKKIWSLDDKYDKIDTFNHALKGHFLSNNLLLFLNTGFHINIIKIKNIIKGKIFYKNIININKDRNIEELLIDKDQLILKKKIKKLKDNDMNNIIKSLKNNQYIYNIDDIDKIIKNDIKRKKNIIIKNVKYIELNNKVIWIIQDNVDDFFKVEYNLFKNTYNHISIISDINDRVVNFHIQDINLLWIILPKKLLYIDLNNLTIIKTVIFDNRIIKSKLYKNKIFIISRSGDLHMLNENSFTKIKSNDFVLSKFKIIKEILYILHNNKYIEFLFKDKDKVILKENKSIENIQTQFNNSSIKIINKILNGSENLIYIIIGKNNENLEQLLNFEIFINMDNLDKINYTSSKFSLENFLSLITTKNNEQLDNIDNLYFKSMYYKLKQLFLTNEVCNHCDKNLKFNTNSLFYYCEDGHYYYNYYNKLKLIEPSKSYYMCIKCCLLLDKSKICDRCYNKVYYLNFDNIF